MDLVLRPTWPGHWHRAVRDPKGNVLRILQFTPGVVYDLDGDDLAAVKADIGITLLPVEYREGPEGNKERPRIMVDGVAQAVTHERATAPEPAAPVLTPAEAGTEPEAPGDPDKPARRKRT